VAVVVAEPEAREVAA
jgi:hypothetical protein